jgi:hypothetical protein
VLSRSTHQFIFLLERKRPWKSYDLAGLICSFLTCLAANTHQDAVPGGGPQCFQVLPDSLASCSGGGETGYHVFWEGLGLGLGQTRSQHTQTGCSPRRQSTTLSALFLPQSSVDRAQSSPGRAGPLTTASFCVGAPHILPYGTTSDPLYHRMTSHGYLPPTVVACPKIP